MPLLHLMLYEGLIVVLKESIKHRGLGEVLDDQPASVSQLIPAGGQHPVGSLSSPMIGESKEEIKLDHSHH